MRHYQNHPEHPGYIDLNDEDDTQGYITLFMASKAHPEFAIDELMSDPGTWYGPYHIIRRREGLWGASDVFPGCAGVVGSVETLEEALELLPRLAEQDVKPLPYLSTEEPVRFLIANGYQAEALIYTKITHDIEDMYALCAIFNPHGEWVSQVTFGSLDDLVKLRDDDHFLKDIIHNNPVKGAGVCILFDQAQAIKTDKPGELNRAIGQVSSGDSVKIVLGDSFEVLLTKRHKNIIRDPDGNVTEKNQQTPSCTYRMEEVFDVIVRAKEGQIHRLEKDISIDCHALCELIRDPALDVPFSSVAMDYCSVDRLEVIAYHIGGDVKCARPLGKSRPIKPLRVKKYDDSDALYDEFIAF